MSWGRERERERERAGLLMLTIPSQSNCNCLGEAILWTVLHLWCTCGEPGLIAAAAAATAKKSNSGKKEKRSVHRRIFSFFDQAAIHRDWHATDLRWSRVQLPRLKVQADTHTHQAHDTPLDSIPSDTTGGPQGVGYKNTKHHWKPSNLTAELISRRLPAELWVKVKDNTTVQECNSNSSISWHFPISKRNRPAQWPPPPSPPAILPLKCTLQMRKKCSAGIEFLVVQLALAIDDWSDQLWLTPPPLLLFWRLILVL